MSSACDGDAIANARPKSAGIGHRPVCHFPYIARSIASPRSIAHLMRSARLQGRGYRRRREEANELRVSSPSSLKRQAPAPLGERLRRSLTRSARHARSSGRHYFMVSAEEVHTPFLLRALAFPRLLLRLGVNCGRRVRHAGSVPRRPQERHDANVTDDAVACGVVCASLSQGGIPRMRNGAQTNRAQTPPPGLRSAAMLTRYDG